jgi:hypothetical protein
MQTFISRLTAIVLFCVLGNGIIFAQTDSTFKPSGKFTLQFFADYYFKVKSDSLNRGNAQYSNVPENYSNFEIRRVYLGYNYDISPDFSTEFLLAHESNTDVQGERSIYVKLANVHWKNIYSNAELIFGAQSTPTFAFSTEPIWGYRSIEKTLTDKYKIASSTDVGLGLRGAFDDAHNFGYDLLYGNGTAQKPENDRYKRVYGDLWSKFMDKKIMISLYGDFYRTSANPSINYTTFKAFAAYQTAPITVGVEGFMQSQSNNVIDSNIAAGNHDTSSVQPFGISFFVTGQIIANKLNFFARYDMFNPDNNYEVSGVTYPKGYNSNKENFIVAGLDWTPLTNVHIMPNIWYNGYMSKVDGATGALKSDGDIVPRMTIFYKF